MTLTKSLLTSHAAAHTITAKVPNLSMDDLRRLLLLCAQDDALDEAEPPVASHVDLNLRELLRGRILDAFILEDRLVRLAWHATVTAYVMHGDAKRAARITKRSERTVQKQAADFLAFAADWLLEAEDRRTKRALARDEDWQRRVSQCELICGRKSYSGSGGGTEWTGCQLCPVSQTP